MTEGRIDIITMGCSKNLVDSERLMRRLQAKGYSLHHDSHHVSGEVAVINTCGFIGDAKKESIDMILRLCQAKEAGQIGRLYVMGCLSERYLSDLKAEIQEVDGWYGKFNWDEIVSLLPDRTAESEIIENTSKAKTGDVTPDKSSSAKKPQIKPWERVLTTPPFSAYIKISEGCNRMCAYCAIPLITGRHRSRTPEEILEEVTYLASQGVKEFNVIAQDLSSYGMDLGGKSLLAGLIDRMADIPGVEWIRLHYAYPVDFPWDVLEVMRRRENVCNYLDIALQHISTPVLANMRRHIDKEQTLALIDRIRREVPGICLRTTLMTGFPGEGEAEYQELKEFVQTAKFDRLGVFAYSEEEGTWAASHLSDDISEDVKNKRRDELLEIQELIALDKNEALIGKKIKVLIESVDDEVITGRSQWDSPEVDFQINIDIPEEADFSAKRVQPGDFVEVEITDVLPYDLYGKIV